ncbi:MAG: hypothetical protein IPM39_20140 [Chloroflexi bacterium]|nr:hypothetical protein [Chloroflexota bacterium]
MSTNKQPGKSNFGFVVLGLLLTIGLIVGGTYFLNAQGWISAGDGEGRGERPNFMAEGEFRERPSHGDQDEAGGFDGRAAAGVLKTLLQFAIVIAIVIGGQKIYAWWSNRQHMPNLPRPAD